MKTLFHILSISCLTVLLTPVSQAEELNFATTSSGILEKLTQPQPTTNKPQQLLLRGAPQQTIKELRGLVRVKVANPKHYSKNNLVMIKEQLEMPIYQESPHVNLKIEFQVDSYAIQSSSYKILYELILALQDSRLKQQNFYINGHTDSDGEQDYNLKLSLNRALVVKEYLIAHTQISPERLTVMGYGENMPLLDNSTPDNKQRNRRVEIVVREAGQ